MDKRKSAKRNNSILVDQNCALPPELNELFLQAIQLKVPNGPATEYLLKEILSKYLDEDGAFPAPVRREAAIAKWRSCEIQNSMTNERLNYMSPIEIGGIPFAKMLSCVQQLVASCIGETVPVEALIGSFSGGSTTSRRRTRGHPGLKYSGQADITAAALPWFKIALSECPGWDTFDLDLNIVKGNVMFTVPKKTDIDRVACKEPDVNMWLQKGVGNYFRTCLKKKGIDLNDQSVNRRLALTGSITRDLATLDLSSASDSVTTGLCELVLPHLWFDLLMDLRSPITNIDGDTHDNEMMSSMGNGFTFELESLIFWAITKAVSYLTKTRGRISVYGDDIICPTESAPLVIEWLEWFGFTVNTEKSFYSRDTGFRESCGGHYLDGNDISPFYLKAPIKRLTDLIKILNKIRKWSAQVSDFSSLNFLDEYFEDEWRFFSTYVPKKLKGGSDYALITQLVTFDVSSKRLIEYVKNRKICENPQYVHWLNTTWTRKTADDGIQTSLFPKNIEKIFTLRSASRDACGLVRKIPIFLSEL